MQALRLILALGLLLPMLASAQISIDGPWVRGTVPGQKATGAFMRIRSSEAASLISASSPAAGSVELHAMEMDGSIMKMRPVRRLALPAGKTVELKSGGYHFMLIDLVQPLKKGDKVPLFLTFEGKDAKRSSVAVEAEVRELGATGGQHGQK